MALILCQVVGPAEAIYAPPYHPYTEALLAAVPIPDPSVDDALRAAMGQLQGRLYAKVSSIQEKLLVLPPETVVWPGHGYGGSRSTIEEERRSNPYLR